jgi:hypothetical protein
MLVEIRYSEYKDFGGVKFPMKIRQTIGGHPALDLTVTDVQPNVAVSVTIPDAILNTPTPYAKVTSQKVAAAAAVVAEVKKLSSKPIK